MNPQMPETPKPSLLLLCCAKALLVNLSTPFAQDPSVANMIHLRPGVPVGNWRDSNNGLGGGRIPFDVNTALVPAALRSIPQLAAAGIVNTTLGQQAAANAEVWENKTLPFFHVNLTVDQAQSLLNAYSQNVSIPVPQVSMNNTAMPDHFYALSLYDNGTAVPILHSDVAFNLLYTNNTDEDLVRTVPLLLSPFPQGLLTGKLGLTGVVTGELG